MSFLPNDYTLPSSGGKYTKLPQGETKLRILSDSIVGYEYWTNENRPSRSRQYPTDTSDARVEDNGKQSQPKHFWAIKVYNYTDQCVQVWQVSQKSIQQGLLALVSDVDWGNPKDYDIKVNRTGEGLDTRYSVNPSPKKELAKEVSEADKNTPVNLELLFEGGDPFLTDSDGEVDDADNPMADTPF